LQSVDRTNRYRWESLSRSSRRLRVLRIADVPRDRPGGMHGFMTQGGAELELLGQSVDYWFAGDLAAGHLPPQLRRIVIPWLIAFKLLRTAISGTSVDIAEIHEPLAGPYAVLRRWLRSSRLPRCVVLSYGLEERSWAASRDRLRRRGQRLSIKSRISVPLTLVFPARVGLRFADAILVPSTADRSYLIERRRISPERIHCVWTGVGEEYLSARAQPAATSALLFIGSWIDRKGTPELVAAWQRLSTEHPDLRLTLAGTGVETPEVLGDFPAAYRDRVTVLPVVDQQTLLALIEAHGIFVLPSWFEGMPLAMLEAAAAGLPCVVGAICGNLDFFRPPCPERDGGLLVHPQDPDALVIALERLLSDPALRSQLGAHGRARAREFTWGHNATLALHAYLAALGRQLRTS
jgi:glycosyltransferase involved in cell wall biosynthesis